MAAISLLILCLVVLAGSGTYLFTKHNSIPQPTSLPTNPEPMVQTASLEQTQSPQPTPEHAISVIPKNIIVGDYISFGSYEQDNDVTNGKEPIEWLVLDVQEGKAKILSRYALNCRNLFN